MYENKVFHCAHCGIRAHKDCLNFIPSTCGMAGDQLRGTLRITVTNNYNCFNKKKQFALIFFQTYFNDSRLTVHVHEAKHITAMDVNGKSDPYVKISSYHRGSGWSDGSKTRTRKKTLNPTWNEKLTVFLDTADTDCRVLIEVYDWDGFSDDDLIGGFSISGNELMKNSADGWFRLLGKNESLFYNIPVGYSKEKLEQIWEEMDEYVFEYCKDFLILFSDEGEESGTAITDFNIQGI